MKNASRWDAFVFQYITSVQLIIQFNIGLKDAYNIVS